MPDNRHFLTSLLTNGASEIIQKISRIAVVIVVARVMEAEAIGLAAAAIAAGDILKSLTETGVVQRIIAAPDKALPAVVTTARRLFRLWCIGLFTVQCLFAAGIWMWSGGTLIPLMIALLALEYLVMPAGIVHCALAMRAGKLTGTAGVAGGQVVLANILTAGLAMVFPSPLALILPRVLTAPVWLIGMRRLHPDVPAPVTDAAPVSHFVGFGACLLGSEVIKTLRLQGDKLVIGATLGAEALGIYFFAFNAGLSLATSISTAFSRVVFPTIAAATNRARATGEAVWLGLLFTTPIVILQALATPYYVPFLLGEDWAYISPIVSILCLAAIPTMVWSGTAQWLRAEDRALTELAVTTGLTVSLLTATYFLSPLGLEAIAWGYLAISCLVQLVASVPLFLSIRRMEA
ncbi:oligosaccharide flippase family protein [Loktanella sp. F6476L]|uniref:oligosaccharide flippase family protein n=1 Tax=Loktanella sp. F6476L TaxID=2926405 RepID=UPI001FF3E771|nr:oligosaccharide flippase family protein [Loktanella sp. F6476L]MCK0120951.1 oligosaccharide flippase family protein [Loktanella sp. F6476L]